MPNKTWKRKLEKKVKDYLKDYPACHDFYHHDRTKKYALEIAKKVKCDEDIVYAGALIHDIGYKGNEQDDSRHNHYGMKLAKKWLKEISFSAQKIDDVLEVIRLHDNVSWADDHEPTEHVEVKIVQDADRLDNLGAIGMARLSYYFGERGLPIYNPAKVGRTKKLFPHHSLLDQMNRSPMKSWKNLNFTAS